MRKVKMNYCMCVCEFEEKKTSCTQNHNRKEEFGIYLSRVNENGRDSRRASKMCDKFLQYKTKTHKFVRQKKTHIYWQRMKWTGMNGIEYWVSKNENDKNVQIKKCSILGIRTLRKLGKMGTHRACMHIAEWWRARQIEEMKQREESLHYLQWR